MLAVMIANILSGVLFVGLWRARKIYDDRQADGGTLACILFPLVTIGLCLVVVLN